MADQFTSSGSWPYTYIGDPPPACIHGISGMRCYLCLPYGSLLSDPAGINPAATVAPAGESGWECPKCGQVWAPWIACCTYCPGRVVTTVTSNVQPTFIGKTAGPTDPAPLVLGLPAEFTDPTYVRHIDVSDPDWHEFLPGAQIRIIRLIRAESARVEFRLAAAEETDRG